MRYKIYMQIRGKERVYIEAGNSRAAAVYDFHQRVNNTMSKFNRESSPYRNQITYIDYWLVEVQKDVISGKDFEFIIMQVRVSGRVII